ncbi:imidazole glycerol phosphate synthase subunit HisF [Polynucleobacter paneuropaeus]|nr:imidazole glycerol phosphate synthase subunit HisF [Polynucleobacter paneuropaeus]
MVKNTRLISRLDIKGSNLIKGVHLEGLRVIGSPQEHAGRYYQQGIDELIYIDCVASLYGRNHLSDIISSAAADIFVPLTVGGGIRSVEDAAQILRVGADKVAINTAAVKRPELITEIAQHFGKQCMVLSIAAKEIRGGVWEVFTDNARESTGLNVVEWACKAAELGAGEILLTSIDCEGTRKGFDIALVKAVSEQVDIPVIASGGMGVHQHAVDVVIEGGADAVAMADILHYGRSSVGEIRTALKSAGLGVRNYA